MKVLILSMILTSFSAFADTNFYCLQHCPDGQICESSGFSFTVDEAKSEVLNLKGIQGEILSHKLKSETLKVKLDSDYGPMRTFKIDLRKLGSERPAGRVRMYGVLSFKVFCWEDL